MAKAILVAVVAVLVVTFVVQPVDSASDRDELRRRQDAAITQHRQGDLIVLAPAGAAIEITQQRHEFSFGTCLSNRAFDGRMPPADRRNYLETVAANFNSAVHENALKWTNTERRPGRLTWQIADAAVQWCRDHDIHVRGHCVYWAVTKRVQPWVQQLNDQHLRVNLERRARQVATRYRGRIDEFDVNNEMLHGRYYADRLGDDIRPQMFKWLKHHNPDAILYVNDYRILTGHDADRYIKQIRAL